MTIRFNPPIVVDLTAYLAAKGVDIPNARIKVYSAYAVGVSQRTLTGGSCYYLLGENGWKNLSEYAGALRNYAKEPEGVQAPHCWHYNQCNFAVSDALKEWQLAQRKEQVNG